MLESPNSPSSNDYSSANGHSQPHSSDITRRGQELSQFFGDGINSRLNKILLNADKMMKSGKIDDIQNGLCHLNLLVQKIKFLQANGKNFDKKIQLFCCYNLSCGYQAMAFNKNNPASMESCILYLQKSLGIIKTLIDSGSEKNYFFKLSFLQVKMNLQFCALLSQIDKHKQALKLSIECINQLIKIFQKGLKQCEILIEKNNSKNEEVIFFSKDVLKKAKKYLLDLVKTQNYYEVLNSDHYELLQIKQKTYFWKTNFENNQKCLRKQLHVQRDQQKNDGVRNILGIKVSNDWIKNYTIGKIMHMKSVDCVQMQQPDNIIFEFNYRNILEKIILTSVAYFSIATEMRFLETDPNKAQTKDKKVQKSNQIKKSQIFHLKSLEIACKYIKQSSLFVDHLINSYHRHYNNNLNTIDEQSSSAQYSLMSSRSKNSKSEMSNKLQSILSDYNEINEKKVVVVKEKQPIFLFNKKKKSSLLESVEFQRSSIGKNERESQVSIRERTMKRSQLKKKLQKSSSMTNMTSLRSQKKSFSSRAKDSRTIKMKKSPEPSFSSSKTKNLKNSKKNARIFLTHRER